MATPRRFARPELTTGEHTAGVPNFRALGWYKIKRKSGGWKVAAIEGIPGFDPRPLRNTDVTIDNVPYHVEAVEVFLTRDPTGMKFGLAVKDDENQ